MGRRARVALSVLATLALLGLVFRKVDLGGVLALFETIDLRWAAIAILLGPVQYSLAGFRWKLISDSLGAPLEAGGAIREYGLSSLLNQLLPGGVAGDAVRVWRQGTYQPLPGALRAALLDRWIGLWVHALITLIGVVLAGLFGIRWSMEAVLVAGLLVALSSVPLWRGSLGEEARLMLHHRGGGVIVLSALLTASFLAAFSACGLALGISPGLWSVTAVPLVLLSMVFPLSIGGWGLREATAVALFPRIGWSMESALALSALYGLTSLLGALPGGLTLLFSGRRP